VCEDLKSTQIPWRCGVPNIRAHGPYKAMSPSQSDDTRPTRTWRHIPSIIL